jgi:hypothetical protein
MNSDKFEVTHKCKTVCSVCRGEGRKYDRPMSCDFCNGTGEKVKVITDYLEVAWDEWDVSDIRFVKDNPCEDCGYDFKDELIEIRDQIREDAEIQAHMDDPVDLKWCPSCKSPKDIGPCKKCGAGYDI